MLLMIQAEDAVMKHKHISSTFHFYSFYTHAKPLFDEFQLHYLERDEEETLSFE